MAASWDPNVPEKSQAVAAREARAAGLHWTFGPMLDICRDARWGRIVMVSSVAGTHGNPGQAAYGASKAGMIGLARTLAKEYARKNVTVNAVAPGPVATAMTEGLVDKIAEAVPLGRPGTVDEVAAAVGFLASDDAAYVTGVVLPVDGGMTA